MITMSILHALTYIHSGQCDLFVKYPYDDVPTCLSKEDRKNLSDKLAKELADISAWSG